METNHILLVDRVGGGGGTSGTVVAVDGNGGLDTGGGGTVCGACPLPDEFSLCPDCPF